MRGKKIEIVIEASCSEVFDLLHNYDRRLEWDPLLSEAMLLEGAQRADKGVRTRCTGKMQHLWISMETEYISFEPGRVAAVRLIGQPILFGEFSASINHRPITESSSSVEYIYSFSARPRWLAWLLEPILNLALQRETEKRLRHLKEFVESQ